MPDQVVQFEGAEHHFPSDFGPDDIAGALQSMHPTPVDMRPRNGGTDTSGQGFWSHALSTVQSLPQSFQSGSVLSDPIRSLGQNMQDYIQSPSLHRMLRAIPGMSMLEDAFTRPYQTAASGDTAGAWGDAVDLATQTALGLHGQVPEPIQELKIPGKAPASATAPIGVLPKVPQTAVELARGGSHIPVVSHVATPTYGVIRSYNALADIGNTAKNSIPPASKTILYDTRMPFLDRAAEGEAARQASLDAGQSQRLEPSPFPQFMPPEYSMAPVATADAKSVLPSRRPIGSLARVQALGLDLPTPPIVHTPGWQELGLQPSPSVLPNLEPIPPEGGILPTGREVGPNLDVLKPAPANQPPIPGWQALDIQPSPSIVPAMEPINGTLPSGRFVGPNLNIAPVPPPPVRPPFARPAWTPPAALERQVIAPDLAALRGIKRTPTSPIEETMAKIEAAKKGADISGVANPKGGSFAPVDERVTRPGTIINEYGKANDTLVAKYLIDNGITDISKLDDDQLNLIRSAAKPGIRPLGKGGPAGRSAELARQHLQEELNKQKARYGK